MPDALAGTLDAKLRAAGIETIFVKAFMRDLALSREWRALRELMRIFRAEQPDVVHLNSSKAGGLGALAALLSNVPRIVFTVHGLPHDEDRNFLWRAGAWLGTWFTCVLCDVVITVSKDNYRRAQRMPFCRRKVRLVHNGIAALSFMDKDAARATIRKHIPSAPQDGLWVGGLGELTWNKGFHHLVRGAALAMRKGSDFSLVIIGEGEERRFLGTLAEEHQITEKVFLPGFMQEGYRYLKAFDVFVVPSVKEGLPYVLIEAGQAQRAVLGSNISGVVDIIGDNVSGLLFPSKDADVLARELYRMLEDSTLRDKLSKNLHERVMGEFSLESMVKHTTDLYDRPNR